MGDWTAVTPVSTLFLTLYATVSPGFLWYIVHKMVSTRSPALMFRYSSLVFSFRDDARYGAFVIVIRKIAVVLVAPVLAFQIPYEVASGRDTFPAVAIALVVAGFLIHHVRSWPYHWKSCNVAEMVAYSGLLTLLLLFHVDAVAVYVTVFALVILFFVVSIGHFFYRRYSRRFIPSRDTTELAQQREREMAFLQRSQKSLFLPAASPTTSAKKLNQVAPMTQNTLSPYSNVQARPKTLVKPPPPAAHLPPGPTTLHGTFLGEGPLPAMIAGRTSGAKPPLGKGKHEGKGKGKKGDKKRLLLHHPLRKVAASICSQCTKAVEPPLPPQRSLERIRLKSCRMPILSRLRWTSSSEMLAVITRRTAAVAVVEETVMEEKRRKGSKEKRLRGVTWIRRYSRRRPRRLHHWILGLPHHENDKTGLEPKKKKKGGGKKKKKKKKKKS